MSRGGLYLPQKTLTSKSKAMAVVAELMPVVVAVTGQRLVVDQAATEERVWRLSFSIPKESVLKGLEQTKGRPRSENHYDSHREAMGHQCTTGCQTV